MTNNPKSDDFERLLKLLALKRHERPPPGFFEHFSSEVIARLSAGEAQRRRWWMDIFDEAIWVKRLWAAFEVRPVLAGLYGVVLCALILSAIIYSQRPERNSNLNNPPTGQALFSGMPKQGIPQQPTGNASFASTNPIVEPQIPGSVFEMFRPTAQPQLIVYPKNN